MRHRVAGWKLGRNTEHRRALLRNLVTSLIVEERIETTITKAKAMRSHVDKMITLGKRGDVAARRLAAGYLIRSRLASAIARAATLASCSAACAKAMADRRLSLNCWAAKKPSMPSARSVPKPVPSVPKRPARPWKKRALNSSHRLRAAANRRIRNRAKPRRSLVFHRALDGSRMAG